MDETDSLTATARYISEHAALLALFADNHRLCWPAVPHRCLASHLVTVDDFIVDLDRENRQCTLLIPSCDMTIILDGEPGCVALLSNDEVLVSTTEFYVYRIDDEKYTSFCKTGDTVCKIGDTIATSEWAITIREPSDA